MTLYETHSHESKKTLEREDDMDHVWIEKQAALMVVHFGAEYGSMQFDWLDLRDRGVDGEKQAGRLTYPAGLHIYVTTALWTPARSRER